MRLSSIRILPAYRKRFRSLSVCIVRLPLLRRIRIGYLGREDNRNPFVDAQTAQSFATAFANAQLQVFEISAILTCDGPSWLRHPIEETTGIFL